MNHLLMKIFLILIATFSQLSAEESAPQTPTQQPLKTTEAVDWKGAANDYDFTSEMLNMVTTLVLLLLGMLALSWVIKRFLSAREQQMNETSGIKILERRSLHPKAAIYLIEVGGEEIVIAESPMGITRLSSRRVEELSFRDILTDRQEQGEV
jgi:flagellar biosynthetic protein FliO